MSQSKFSVKLSKADDAAMAGVAQVMRAEGEPFPTRSDVIRYALRAALNAPAPATE